MRQRLRRINLLGMMVIGLGAAAVALQAVPSPARSAPPKRPNIVFVLTDDLATNLVQYMPHVLAMQAKGVTFANYFVTDSLCCPSGRVRQRREGVSRPRRRPTRAA